MDPIDAPRCFPDDILPPEGQYSSREELFASIQAWAAPRGYAFVTGKSKTTDSGRVVVTYSCDRAGKPPSASASKRRRQTSSRRTDCLFSVLAKEDLCKTVWSVKHRPGAKHSQHNHEPSLSQAAHPTHRQLSTEEESTVQQLSNAGIAPKEIRSFLRLTSDTLATQQDIYNYIARGKQDLTKGQSNMHALANQLESEGF